MDSVTIKPVLSSFSFNLSNPLTNPLYSTSFSFFRFSHFRKFSTSSIPLCYSRVSNPKNTNSKFSIQNFPPNPPVWVLVPILQSIKRFATSQTQKWASCVQAYSDSEKIHPEFDGGYLQNGGIGVALLSVTSTAKVRISPFVATLAANPTFVSGLFAWFVAQSIKIVLNFFVERKWDLRILFASGGMPSSHSALCTALTTSVAFCHGVADSLFPVCLGFSLIVMYDAIGVRRHAGMQAEYDGEQSILADERNIRTSSIACPNLLQFSSIFCKANTIYKASPLRTILCNSRLQQNLAAKEAAKKIFQDDQEA